MREKNELEIIMQLKMEEFRMEPRPSDWQAIYDQLHPRKKRRFLWWWLPLLAGLSLFGAFWLYNRNNADLPVSEKTSIISSVQKTVDNKSVDDQQTNASTPDHKITDTHSPGSSIVTENKNVSAIEFPKEQQQEQYLPKPVNSAQVSENINPVADKNELRSEVKNTIQEEIIGSGKKTEKTPDAIQETTVAREPESKSSQPDSAIPDSVRSTATPEVEKRSIPNLSTHMEKGWYFGVYARIAVNKPVEPVSMMKFADFSSMPGSGTTSYSLDNLTSKNGLHYSLGVALERKMKSMSFQTGLGFQYSSWSSSTAVYQNTISTGNIMNRTLLGTMTTENTLLALEVPAIFNIRMWGKKNSFWVGAGLNNAIGLKLNRTSDASTLPNFGNPNSQADAKVTTYQPQLHLGLIYEHAAKKYHWHLSPFLQYGLNKAAGSGVEDHLLHLGIQGRYYFRKLK